MAGMIDLEMATQRYADARSGVSAIVSAMEEEIAAVKKRHMARLKKAVGYMAELRNELMLDIRDNAELFTKRRTMVLHGIKIGIQKQKGEITWTDEAQVIKLIHKHFPDMAETLIKTTEKPIKSALAQLPAADLKKLGVTITDDSDAIVIRATDSEIDKLVEALLKDEEIKEAKEAA
jgi:hypothetical protein